MKHEKIKNEWPTFEIWFGYYFYEGYLKSMQVGNVKAG